MFTGIVREIGTVRGIGKSGDIYRLDIRSESVIKGLGIGDSVAVNGACLTVTERGKDALRFDIMGQTARNTSVAGLKSGDRVNLEGAMKAGGALDGHFVLGHVDCAGKIVRIGKAGDGFTISISFPEGFNELAVDKGSITVDGVSLTIGRAGNGSLDVDIIPHTLKSTNLGSKNAGDTVNLEFDILGKYIARRAALAGRSRITEEFLRSNGF